MNKRLIALLSVLALVIAACGSGDETAEDPAVETTVTTEASTETTMAEEMAAGTIVDVAVENEFTTLVAAVEAAGLVETLQGEGPFTVFAPTDEAFAALPDGLLESLLADTETLTSILTYHVVAGEVLAADVVGLESATTVQGEDISIAVEGDSVVLNGSATVVATDVAASNGVVHVIDQVILPPTVAEALAASDAEATAEDIIGVARAAGSFNTLLTAVDAAGLTETLQGAGPFTVFAPTDEAFAALGEDTIAGLLEDTETLASILTYHVVSGEVFAADVVELDSATTVQGEDIAISVEGGNVFLNGNAQVVTTDIVTANGIIHVIDAVILPPSAQ